MLLTGLLLLGASAAPIEARVTEIGAIRTKGVNATWYNKVEVELTSAARRSLRMCPNDASVTTARLVGDKLRPVDRFPAHAMTVAGADRTGDCRELVLRPGVVQRVTFLVREVPGGWRGEDRYSFNLVAGERLFRFVQPGRRTPG